MTHLIELRYLQANGIRMRVAIAGDGPNVLLLHGWPFTWFLWRQLLPTLAAAGYRAIAPNLRGIAETERPAAGYDLHTLADEAAALLDALGAARAAAIGFDLGVAPAFMLAARHPERVERLVLMEALLGHLPGGERFLAPGEPWWFVADGRGGAIYVGVCAERKCARVQGAGLTHPPAVLG